MNRIKSCYLANPGILSNVYLNPRAPHLSSRTHTDNAGNPVHNSNRAAKDTER